MILKKRMRPIGAMAAIFGAVGLLTLGLAGPAAASEAAPWSLKLCSYGSFTTDFYRGGVSGAFSVQSGACRTIWYQNTSAEHFNVTVEGWVQNANPGHRLVSLTVDVAKGQAIATTGWYQGPNDWSTGYYTF
jgi:hypothetical protein